jgi:hypothetical protein
MVKPLPPRTPIPPASETATTSSTGAPVVSPISVGPIPAHMMGYSIPSISQSFVRNVRLAIKFLLDFSQLTLLRLYNDKEILVKTKAAELRFFLTFMHSI